MRTAQSLHSWQRVTSDWAGETGFARLATSAQRGFDASSVNLSGGAIILAGVNSGGKSRLLRSIWSETYEPQAAWTSLEWSGPSPSHVVHVDLFSLLERQSQALRAPDLLDQVDAVGLTPLRQPETRELCYVLGRNYESIKVAELDSIEPGSVASPGTPPQFRDDVVPYFEVTIAGMTHGSSELSRGELSALTLHWVLQTAPPDAVLLLDEPDLMLSPLSAERALNLVVDFANSRKLPVVIATHSYLGLARAPRSAQVLLRVSDDGGTTLATPDNYALWEALRVTPPLQIAMVVEDKMAKLLLREMLQLIEYQHFDVSDIWIGGSSAEVRAIGRVPLLAEAQLAFWGVLDANETMSKKEPQCFALPGIWAPEEGAIKIASEYPMLVTEMTADLRRALDRTIGDDPHDTVHAVARAIGESGESFVVRAWRQWVTQTDDGRAALRDFCHSAQEVKPPAGASQ